jgi:hypothetical protein
VKEYSADIAIIGGGLGGVAAALGALRSGRTVAMTEEFDWLGGQMTSQAAPPDEHSWVEQFGITRSYRALRNGIRQYYRDHYPLTEKSRAWGDLNPGAGHVSRLCHEPRVGVAVMEAMLMPYRGGGRLIVLQPYDRYRPKSTVTASAPSPWRIAIPASASSSPANTLSRPQNWATCCR